MDFTMGLPTVSFRLLKIHPVLLADEWQSSKSTHNENFTKMWLD